MNIKDAINLVDGINLCASGVGVSVAYITLEGSLKYLSMGISILSGIVTIALRIAGAINTKLKEAKSPESEGGEKITENEKKDIVKAGFVSVISIVDELKELCDRKEELETEIEESQRNLIHTGKKKYYRIKKADEEELEEVNSRITRLEELKKVGE